MIIPDIIEQHYEEAAMLWSRRNGATEKASFELRNLGELDERVEAHLDALRIAGKEGWELCQKAAEWEGGGEAFTMGVLSFAEDQEARFKEVLKHAVENPKLGEGLSSSLGWMEPAMARSMIQTLLGGGSPAERRIGLDAAVAHRMPLNGVLSEALKDGDELLKVRACQAAGEMGRADLAKHLQPCLGSENKDCAFWAAWSLTVLSGEPVALNTLRDFMAAGSSRQSQAANLYFRRLAPGAAVEGQKQIARAPEAARLAIIVAGIIGDPVLVPWLLEQMDIPARSRLAAEAFQTITGADFVMDRLRNGTPPRPGVAEDEGKDQPDDDDGDLTWPNPAAIKDWWTQRKARFVTGTRHMLGKPMTVDWLQEVLRMGHQGQRAAAALELAIRQPGQLMFNIGAPVHRQKAALGGMAKK